MAQAADEDAVAIGDQANAGGFHSTAVGGEAVATGRGSQAFGWQSRATGNLALAVGHQANAGGINATALGKNTNAAFDASTAVGFAATTSRANQVVLGGTGSSVTVGDIAASTAAQVGTTALVTVDATGTLGRDTTTLGSFNSGLAANNAVDLAQAGQITSLQTQTSSLFSLAANNSVQIQKANEGVAIALAMETPSLPPGTKFGLAGGFGYYNHRTAGTASVAARIGTNASISAGIGVGLNSGEVGARGGFQFAW